MKRSIFSALILLLVLLPGLRSYADVPLLDTEKNKLQLYGFFKLDAAYQNGGVNGLTFPRYAVTGNNNLHLSATHSRFGFKYAGTPLSNGMNVAAVLEWDLFDPTSPNQMKLRFRQGYFTLAKKGHSLLFGQAWDLFSPLGPTTLMTNGYLWQTGNLGFRHAQIRYAYSAPRFDFAFAVSDPTSSWGSPIKLPVFQSRVGVKLGEGNKYQLGVSGIFSRNPVEISYIQYKNLDNTLGVSLDWNLAFGKLLSLKGEFARGENLAYVSSRAGFYTDLSIQQTLAKKVQDFWTELLLAKGKWSGWLGYAMEDLTDREQLGPNELKKTACALAGIQFAPGSGVSFGLEFAHFDSAYSNRLAEHVKTNQVMFSAILNL